MKEEQNSEETNEYYFFSLTSNALLGAIVKGEINAIAHAKRELANRGYDENGIWIGFDEARKHFDLDPSN